MRDQLNGQLYDAWRTDCDGKTSEVGHMSASVRIPRLDDKYYSHSAIPPEVGQFMVHDNVRYSCGFGECRGACDDDDDNEQRGEEQ